MVIQRLVELLTPTQCLECGADGPIWCDGCRSDAQTAGLVAVCFRCGRPSSEGRTCAACRPDTEVTGVTVGTYYDGPMKELILQLKFHGVRAAAEVAADVIVEALSEGFRTDMVTAVPVAPARYRERGYNQSELVARQVAARLGLPYSRRLGRTNSAHQLGVGRHERLAQVAGAFYATRQLDGQRVLLVDDVVTTGATLSECAETLRAAGAGQVWGAVVARH